MTETRTAAVEALFIEAQNVHHEFEATELNGVYDEEWPRWYAEYAVQKGIGALIGHPVTADRLAQFLADGYATFEGADPQPSEPWPAYIAGRITTEL